jgi:multidrug efflux pump subunit AcrB
MGQFMAAAARDAQLAGVQTPWRAAAPQLRIDVDREKAKALGVPLEELYGTLAATLGTYYVNDFNPLRAHLAGALVGRPGLPQAAERHRQGLHSQ